MCFLWAVTTCNPEFVIQIPLFPQMSHKYNMLHKLPEVHDLQIWVSIFLSTYVGLWQGPHTFKALFMIGMDFAVQFVMPCCWKSAAVSTVNNPHSVGAQWMTLFLELYDQSDVCMDPYSGSDGDLHSLVCRIWTMDCCTRSAACRGVSLTDGVWCNILSLSHPK